LVVKWPKHHGTRVEIELEGNYRGGQHSVDNYIRQISLANPHAQITYVPPVAEEHGDKHVFPRVTRKLPAHTDEIQPHPYGIELGVLMQMFRDTGSRNLTSCLRNDFSRVSPRVASEICEKAKVSPKRRPADIRREEADAIYKAIKQTKIMSPPTDCIAPIGEDLILAALKAEVEADFYSAVTRRPTIYRGNPFLVEVGLAYGGEMPREESAALYRYANRVPLQYQQGACAITRAVSGTNWKSYMVQHPKGALPVGPLLIMVHIASVWVPFTSESKDAVAQYPEIIKAMGDVVRKGGYGTSVTPVSQFYFQQAFNNVMFGPWEKIAEPYGEMVLGYFGRTPAAPDPEIVKLAAEQLGKEPTTVPVLELNDADSSKGVEAARKLLESAGIDTSDENLFIVATCKEKGIRFLKGEAEVGVRKIDKTQLTSAPPSNKGAEPAEYTVTVNGREYFMALEGNMATVDGKVYRVGIRQEQSTGGGKSPSVEASETTEVKAQMPGLVHNVLVSAGDVINKGQSILVLEAMKMEIAVASPVSGTVLSVSVAIGDQVATGQVLATISL
ncbi:MAG: DNA topoisomerase VI subunit B, partial [Pirellulaceae bacterium]